MQAAEVNAFINSNRPQGQQDCRFCVSANSL